MAEIEGQELSRKAADAAITVADIDPRLVKESFAQLMHEGPAMLEYCDGHSGLALLAGTNGQHLKSNRRTDGP
jgi:hypothetical protein